MNKNKYQDTLNLPRTKLPMKAGLRQREPDMIARWTSLGLYRKLRQLRHGRPRFILHDGPPYANGDIHIGHAVNKILKDIIVKSRSLANYDAPYVPGWDCHGLPIEWQVEKKYGKIGSRLTSSAFRQKCRDYADRQIARQKEDFIRLGVMGDWDHPYQTKTFAAEAAEVRALAKLVASGHIVRGLKSVYWSTGCASALAEAEIEYEEKTSNAVDVSYEAANIDAFNRRLKTDLSQLQVIIWTTTPWTLPASQAVCLNADIDYQIVHHAGSHYLLAADLTAACAARYGWKQITYGPIVKGAELEGLPLTHPLYEDRKVPLVLGRHVDTESGTGCVHTAPAHGPEDFEIGKKYDLDPFCPVDENGVYLKEVPLFGGQFVFSAEGAIIRHLQARGNLVQHQPFTHSYPHCWRTKTPLIFRATTQWFISMEKLRPLAVKAIEQLDFVPEWGRSRLLGMVENRPDWCISRQRFWGVPIPLFVHRESGEMHPNTLTVMERVADRMEKEGIDAWFDSSAGEWLKDGADEYEQTMDIVDVWFDSGVTHFSIALMRDDIDIPADLYLEGSDQHRGWFQSSLLTGVGICGNAPYKGLLTHGFIVDEKGRKMSKSLGNVIAPQKIYNTHGADILRLWVAASDYRQEMAISDDIVGHIADAYRRIRNTARFALGNLYDFDPTQDQIPNGDMVWLDRWAVDRAWLLQKRLQAYYREYRFHLIYQELHNFCTVDMGGFYLDILKDRLYTTKADAPPRQSAQTALYHLLEALVRWIAPILSFTSDEIWSHIPGERSESVLLETWYEGLAALPPNAPFDRECWDAVMTLKSDVSKLLEVLRKDGAIGSSLDAEVDIYADSRQLPRLQAFEDELRFALITSYARVHPIETAPAEASQGSIAGIRITAFASAHPKCARSWHRRKDVGEHPDYPDLDARSIANLIGSGEARFYA